MSSAPKQTSTTPDLSRLAFWPESRWRAFGVRLREIKLNAASLAGSANILPNFLPRMRLPLRQWALRQTSSPCNSAARLLIFADAITFDEAQSAFGLDLLTAMIADGLVNRLSDQTLVSPFRLHLIQDQYILCDDLVHGADAVMGPGETTLSLVKAAEQEGLGRILDLGCGAGGVSIALAHAADSIVATDINPRALAFGRINAAINGANNIEFRLGDLYQPVSGEKFDLILSQPPFIPMPQGSKPATYLFGGPRGDELPMQVLADTTARLADGGSAILLIHFPQIAQETIPNRVRAAIRTPAADLLILQFPPIDLNLFAFAYSSISLPDYGEGFRHEVTTWLDHFRRTGIAAILPCFAVIRKRGRRKGWTRLALPALGTPTPISIDQLFRRFDLLALDDAGLLGAALRLRPDAILNAQQPLATKGETEIRIEFTGAEMNRPAELNREMVQLLQILNRSSNVDRAVQSCRQKFPDWSRKEILEIVRESLGLGLLEVVEKLDKK